ncbi:RNA-directed DNA polymerase, eukaryota, reverse transcriptase zinc-binding domain protein [Tanacetum coccineum]
MVQPIIIGVGVDPLEMALKWTNSKTWWAFLITSFHQICLTLGPSHLTTPIHSPSAPCVDSLKEWNATLPIKVNIHTWRATIDRLPTRYNLDARGIDLDSTRCPICDGCVETSEHLFIDCTVARGLWKMISSWWKLGDYPKDFNNLLSWSDSVDIHDLAK